MINDLRAKINTISSSDPKEISMDSLQHIFDKLSVLISLFGTMHIEDAICVIFGNSFTLLPGLETCEILESKFDLIKKYITINGCKNVSSKIKNALKIDVDCINKISDISIPIEESNQLECYEPVTYGSSFFYSTRGIRIVLQNNKDNKTIIINGTVEDIPLDWLNYNEYIEDRKNKILSHFKETPDVIPELFDRLLCSLSLRDYLIYGKNDIYEKYRSIIKDAVYVKATNIDTIVKNFKNMDTFNKRKTLINLIIYNVDQEVQYIAYMLYDLMSINHSGNETTDSIEQTIIFNSLPWNVKSYFKEAMNNTIHYSNTINNKYESNKITLEQRIIFMKAADSIKEKAISKFKELKNKPEDQGGKIKQYLEGLLKIPFGTFNEEPILVIAKKTNDIFINLIADPALRSTLSDPIKTKYTMFEISRILEKIEPIVEKRTQEFLFQKLSTLNKSELLDVAQHLGNDFQNTKIKSWTKPFLFSSITKYIKENTFECANVYNKIDRHFSNKYSNMNTLKSNINKISAGINEINSTLDESVYGHKNAKSQILKIISQWMNGENTGYCFGFEGSPGIGKTSLAKQGLAKCLIDEQGKSRPFSFIAMGGSCNGSTLEGHNYTYVNSSWGRIVDILMESKCLNPIIYIDELDKVSKTEQGREIIGILTHLIDSTQNDEFQDKYFSGIPIDLSKALFIFSYNDPDQIDKILLDRIHRIKFDNLSTKDKLVVVKRFIIPSINKKMGFENLVQIEDEVIEHIIEYYTMEPGIRKLKEILFDLFGEINIEFLHANALSKDLSAPVQINKQDLGRKYIQKYKPIQETKINSAASIGVINGLWANNLGKGGIIKIESFFFPSVNFLELKLTGMQGDVMKESMNIAKTLAWSLTPDSTKKKIIQDIESTKSQGIHIHCPDGATSKDGPSAGAAITLSLYSLFNRIPIKETVAITGEINLQGEITAIGGLETKILGGIRAGVKTFMYPSQNSLDFEDCELKYKRLFIDKDIKFIAVSNISDALKCAYLE
jgi:ATP-dependent Lon protease